MSIFILVYLLTYFDQSSYQLWEEQTELLNTSKSQHFIIYGGGKKNPKSWALDTA